MKIAISPRSFGIGVAALVTLGLVIAYYRKSEPAKPTTVKSAEIGQAFAALTEKINLSDPQAKTINLGRMPLGAIRELQLAVSGLENGALKEAQSSCSCIQFAPLPVDFQASDFLLNARYFAVRSGTVDVTVALSHVDVSGKSGIVTVRIVGEVAPGDASHSAQLVELVKNPPLSNGLADPTMLIDAKEAQLSVSSNRGLLIDVRPAEEFAHEHAVGSLNIPLAELRPSKAFRDREIFLIGPALVTDPMQKACARLKHQGVERVAIVAGGVLAWQVVGGKVFQELDPQPVIGSLTINDVVQRVAPLDVRFCGLNLGDEFEFRYLFPGGILFPAGSNPMEWIERQLSAEPSMPIVLIDPTGNDYGSLNQNAPAHWLGKVYYLRSGLGSYLQEVTRRLELASTPDQQISSVNGFARRDKLHRTKLPASPGCGSCPK